MTEPGNTANRTASRAPAAPNTSDQPEPRNDGGSTREHNLDKTIEDSFPASDPPSSDPNPQGAE